ncbi:hypothetical protein BBP40_002322 [Aspergillus hancockii]|nr:hypothetical protein BBP40_002322 [Aspergillus hancockii]
MAAAGFPDRLACGSQQAARLLDQWQGGIGEVYPDALRNESSEGHSASSRMGWESISDNSGVYFWISGTLEQRSQSGLVRHLLFQLLSQLERLIPMVFPARWERLVHLTTRERIKAVISWDLPELIDALRCFFNLTAKTEKISPAISTTRGRQQGELSPSDRESLCCCATYLGPTLLLPTIGTGFNPHVSLLTVHILLFKGHSIHHFYPHRQMDDWWQDLILAFTHARLAQCRDMSELDNATVFHELFLSTAAKFGLRYFVQTCLRKVDLGGSEGVPVLSHCIEFLVSRQRTVYPLSAVEIIQDLPRYGVDPNQVYYNMNYQACTPWGVGLDNLQQGDRRG